MTTCGHFGISLLHRHTRRCSETRYGKLLPSIRGIRLTITDVRAKLKFGTNRTVEHRQVIAMKLAERGQPLDLEARTHVLDRLSRRRS